MEQRELPHCDPFPSPRRRKEQRRATPPNNDAAFSLVSSQTQDSHFTDDTNRTRILARYILGILPGPPFCNRIGVQKASEIISHTRPLCVQKTKNLLDEMALFVSSPMLSKRLVPGPSMERGHALNIYAHPKEPKLVYPFGKFVSAALLLNAHEFASLARAGSRKISGKINRQLCVSRTQVRCRRRTIFAVWILGRLGRRWRVSVAVSPETRAKTPIRRFLRVWSWDNPEHTLKLEVQVLGGSILDLAWDSESKRICVVGDGKGVVSKTVMWDTGNSVGEMVGHQKKAITVAYRQDRPFRIMTGSEDFRVVFYKGPPFKMDHSCAEHKNYVNCVRYSPDGEVLVSVGSDKKIVFYDGKEGTVTHKDIKASMKSKHQGSIYSCAFSSDGKTLVTASADKTVKAWDLSGLPSCPVTSIKIGDDVGAMQNAVVWPLSWSSRGGGPISVSLAGDFNYLATDLSGVSKVVVAPQSPLSAMTVVGDDLVVAGCNDGTVFVAGGEDDDWRKVSPAEPSSSSSSGGHVRPCHSGKVTAICTSPFPSSHFATAGFDDKVRLATSESYVAEVQVDGQPVSLASLDDKIVFVTTKGIGIIDESLSIVTFEPTNYDPSALSACGDDVVVGAKDGSLRVFDSNLTEKSVDIAPHRAEITAISFSPDGSYVAVGDADREIKLYGTADFSVKLQSTWRFHTARITALAWHPESKHLASTSNDEVIYVWSLENKTTPVKIDFTHKDGVTALAWLKSASALASAGNDANLCIWKVTIRSFYVLNLTFRAHAAPLAIHRNTSKKYFLRVRQRETPQHPADFFLVPFKTTVLTGSARIVLHHTSSFRAVRVNDNNKTKYSK